MRTALLLTACLAIGASPASAAEVKVKVIDCDLAVHVFPGQHRLEATAVIGLPAGQHALDSVTFTLRPDMSVANAEILAPAASAGPARLHEEAAAPNSEHKPWTLTPSHPFPAGEPIKLKIAYSGGKKQGFLFYLGPEGSFAGGVGTSWYPEFDRRRSTGTLSIAVSSEYRVKASGLPRPPRQSGDETTYEFRVEQPSMYTFALGRYVVRRHEGRVPTTVFFFRERPFAARMAEACGKIVEVLEHEFGPYPFGEFAVIETASPESGRSGFSGASFEGFMFVDSDQLKRGFNLALFGHEIGHQWWGNLVHRGGQKGNFMLDEAMAQYGSLRVIEELEGPAAAARYRWSGYPGYIPTQCGRMALWVAAAGYDLPLDNLPRQGAVPRLLSDGKGFLIYDLLARTIGRDRFREALRRITREHAFGSVSWDEFLQRLQEAAGADLHWFYDQWFARPGAPLLSVQWKQAQDAVRCTILQEGPLFRLTLPVQVVFDDGSSTVQDVEVRGKRTEISVPAPRRAVVVNLDPDFRVFHATPSSRAEASELRLWTKGEVLDDSGQEQEAAKTLAEGLRQLPRPDGHGVEFLLRMQIADSHREAGRMEEARREYERAVACPARHSEYLPTVYLHLAQVCLSLGRREQAAQAARDAESADRLLPMPTGVAEETSEGLRSQNHK